MDTMADFAKKKNSSLNITKFVVAGASKVNKTIKITKPSNKLCRYNVIMTLQLCMYVLEQHNVCTSTYYVFVFYTDFLPYTLQRGWTTWTTGIVDKRVIAIMPIVEDLLNINPV